jgi:hypothetical protein
MTLAQDGKGGRKRKPVATAHCQLQKHNAINSQWFRESACRTRRLNRKRPNIARAPNIVVIKSSSCEIGRKALPTLLAIGPTNQANQKIPKNAGAITRETADTSNAHGLSLSQK